MLALGSDFNAMGIAVVHQFLLRGGAQRSDSVMTQSGWRRRGGLVGLLPLLHRSSPRADSSPACPDEQQVERLTLPPTPTPPALWLTCLEAPPPTLQEARKTSAVQPRFRIPTRKL